MSRALLVVLALGLAFAGVLAPAPAWGSVPSDAEARRIARISEELRCLVCQNQTIADSNAPLANDLKQQIREQIAAGRNDSQIIDYMVQRYGEFVLYRPRFHPGTALLWLGPFVLLIAALGWLAAHLSRNWRSAPAALSDEDRARVAALLAAREEGKS